MIDTIELTTTAKYSDDDDLWIAEIKGYSVSGRGDTPEEAILNARDNIQQFFMAMSGSRHYVSVTWRPVSLKADLDVRIETDRGTSLKEFGLDIEHGEQEVHL